MATLLSSSSVHSIRLSSSSIPSSSSASSHSLPFCTFPFHPGKKALSIKKNPCLFVVKAVEEEEAQQEQVVTEVISNFGATTCCCSNFTFRYSHHALSDSIKDDYRCAITRPDTGGKDSESYKLCSHSINNSMTVVTGRVIIPPSLKLDGNLSVEGKPVQHWAILDFTDDEHDNITNFIEALRHKFTSLGINMEQPLKIFKLENSDSLGELLSRIKTINGRRLQLLLCIMSKNNKVYKLLKFLAETEIGIVTQCCHLTSYNARSGAFLTSLAQKINVKMGGRNVHFGAICFDLVGNYEKLNNAKPKKIK